MSKFLDAFHYELQFLFFFLLAISFGAWALRGLRKSPGRRLYERAPIAGWRKWKDVDPMIQESWEQAAKEDK